MPVQRLLSCAAEGCREQYLQTTERAVRICAAHRAADSFQLVGGDGRLSRWCQQCSRPHHLDRFNGPNRGCENRLRRRRLRVKSRKASKPLGKASNTEDVSTCDDRSPGGGKSPLPVEDEESPDIAKQGTQAAETSSLQLKASRKRKLKARPLEDIQAMEDDGVGWARPFSDANTLAEIPSAKVLQGVSLSSMAPTHNLHQGMAGNKGWSSQANFPRPVCSICDIMSILESGEMVPVDPCSTSYMHSIAERDSWWRDLAQVAICHPSRFNTGQCW